MNTTLNGKTLMHEPTNVNAPRLLRSHIRDGVESEFIGYVAREFLQLRGIHENKWSLSL